MIDGFAAMPRHVAVATLILMTFSRQLAPEGLCARVRELSTNADAMIARNAAFHGRSEMDLLKLTWEQLDIYERMIDAKIALCKLRLEGVEGDAMDRALVCATAALIAWQEDQDE